MRNLSGEIGAELAAPVSTWAHLWRLQRRDGVTFGFTDHDRDLTLEDLTYRSASALAPGIIEKSLELSVDSSSVEGVLSADDITEADMIAGLWDGARVDLWRVNWSMPNNRIHVFSGRLGEVARGALGLTAELRGLQADLEIGVGRVYARVCDARLGDERCGVALATATFQAMGQISALISARAFDVGGIAAFEAGWFTHGWMQTDTGARYAIIAHRLTDGVARLEVDQPVAGATIGALVTVTAGCERTCEACRVKFNNISRFRGFPHIPGNDVLQSGPTAQAVHDGGSRFR